MREFVRTHDGEQLRAQKLLGSGGQGEVWLAKMEGQPVAVKVYHRHTATDALYRPELRWVVCLGLRS